jgi:hypothetical protein
VSDNLFCFATTISRETINCTFARAGDAFLEFETPPEDKAPPKPPEDAPAKVGGSRLPFGPPFPAF